VLRRVTVAAVVFATVALALGSPVIVSNVGATDSAGTGWSGQAGVNESAAGQARISGLYPNPVTDGDRGEFVTVSLPPDANLSGYRLADEQTSVPLSPRATNVTNTTGATLDTPTPPVRTVTFSTDPGLTEWLTDRTVAPLPGAVQLANGGESVRLLHGGTVVDDVRYESAPEGERYNASTGGWEPLGTTDRPVVTATGGTVEAFVLPDEGDRAVELLDSARDRILLAGYTFTAQRVVDALTAALDRGVTVAVLVDGSPVGGMTGDGAAALSQLSRAGATVRVFGGDRERYRYHHAKYAVVDDRALVTSENWKPSGTGGAANRGWGVVTGQDRIVEGLVDTYRADATWVDTASWTESDPTLVESDPSTGGYPQKFERERLPVERTHLLVTPDNAARVVRDRIENAEETLDIKQVRIGNRELPLLQAVLDAAARGVEVRILLSSAWYAAEQNEQLAAWLRDQAAAGDLPLTVRLADPGGAFERIHAKGLVVDGEQVLVGSINWNRNALRNNREVALLLEGAAAGYFESVFDADWQRGESGGRDIPLGVALAVLAAAVAAILAAKHIRFER
jgi:phosphatidylserine/phosphatidylglycerophosphate/cardiolipin synthase-like enzyme